MDCLKLRKSFCSATLSFCPTGFLSVTRCPRSGPCRTSRPPHRWSGCGTPSIGRWEMRCIPFRSRWCSSHPLRRSWDDTCSPSQKRTADEIGGRSGGVFQLRLEPTSISTYINIFSLFTWGRRCLLRRNPFGGLLQEDAN